MENRNYWCFRVDTRKTDYFVRELHEGRLRQGWGWDKKQDLRNFLMDEGAGRNRPMFNNVKKGDILLIPQLPNWGEIAIVEATDDWNIGYRFEIDAKHNDFGHIFPAKYVKKFTRNNENVTGNLRSTLKNPSRFWNINHYSIDVDRLLNAKETALSRSQDYNSRFENAIGSVLGEVFDERMFSDKLFEKLTEQFTREEWEFALEYGLKTLYPFFQVERVGGPEEKNHGTDILIKIPCILSSYNYAIAIQVKDYYGLVGAEVIDQINKADNYWPTKNLKLIEKIVVIVKADKDQNIQLIDNQSNVKFIFANELKQIFAEIGKNFIGINSKML